jgi:2-amino-4-hydroxy-6-hydroxymethyldihydropteridine diphosphokinase
MPRAALGLGSNLGDKRANVARALDLLERGGARVVARSSDYRSEPWGPVAQDWFVNAAVLVETDLPPHELLASGRRVEQELGRLRDVRWGPRTIDVDLLTYGDLSIDTPDLVVPHPRMLERAFVLVPLLEVAPDLTVGGRRIAEVAAGLDLSGVVRLD